MALLVNAIRRHLLKTAVVLSLAFISLFLGLSLAKDAQLTVSDSRAILTYIGERVVPPSLVRLHQYAHGPVAEHRSRHKADCV